MQAHDETSINGLLYLVADEVSKATSRKNTVQKYVVDALCGSPSLTSHISMAMLDHDYFFKTFALYTKNQVKISSIQALVNSADAVGFGDHPILGNPQ